MVANSAISSRNAIAFPPAVDAVHGDLELVFGE
jgi:hypothetical protein